MISPATDVDKTLGDMIDLMLQNAIRSDGTVEYYFTLNHDGKRETLTLITVKPPVTT
jgi:hypothetical protein